MDKATRTLNVTRTMPRDNDKHADFNYRERAISRGFHERLRGSSGRTRTNNHNAFQLLFTFSLLLVL